MGPRWFRVCLGDSDLLDVARAQEGMSFLSCRWPYCGWTKSCMTPYVTRVRRLVIELPAPLECQCCARIWVMQDVGHSHTCTFEALQGQQSQDSGFARDDLRDKSDAGIRPSTVWRLASFRKLWSLVTADPSQLRAVCEGPGWGRKSEMWYFSSFKLFPYSQISFQSVSN